MTFSYRYVVVAALFITCLLTANIMIVKQINIAGFILPAAIIIFPLSYIIGDVLTEVYGYGQARRIIWLGFLCNAVMVAAIWLGGLLPAADTFQWQQEYNIILGSTPRFLLASFAAYLAGEFSNSYVLSRMKVKTRGQWLWTRTIGSTLIGQCLDTVIVLSIAFAGVLPLNILGTMMLTHWIFKVGYEVVATPLTYLVVRYMKRKEGIDVYDYGVNFNPLGNLQ